MQYNTELEEFIELEYKDYNFNELQVTPLKKDDIQNTIKQFMTDLINNIRNNLDFSDVACIMLKILALFTIGILCLLAYLLNYFLDKLLAYLINVLDKIIKIILDKIKSILNILFDKVKEILDMIAEAIEKIKNMILQIIAFIENLILQLLAFIESIINALLTILDRFFEFINNLITWLMNCLSIPDLPNCVANIDTHIDDNIGINEPIIDHPDFRDITNNNYISPPIINEIVNDINNTKIEIQNTISDTILNINRINDINSNNVNNNNINKEIDFINDMVDNLQNQLTTLINNINDNFRNNLINYDIELYNNIYNLTDEDNNNINNILNYFNNTLNEIFDSNMQAILNSLERQLITREIC